MCPLTCQYTNEDSKYDRLSFQGLQQILTNSQQKERSKKPNYCIKMDNLN